VRLFQIWHLLSAIGSQLFGFKNKKSFAPLMKID